MIALNSILVTTDFSDAGNNAVRRAALIAAQHEARVTLLHVVDSDAYKRSRTWPGASTGIDPKVAAAHAALGRLAAEVAGRHDVHVSQVVRVDRPLEHVCRMADEADLLVIGFKRVNPLRSFILGTPTEQLLRLVRRPVLLAKQAALDDYRRVLVAVDLGSDHESMVRSTSALASAASLHVFHALSTRRMDRMRASDVPARVIREVGDGEQQRAIARLRSMLASMGLQGARASVDHGDPRRLTLETQLETGADLVVVGKDGQSAMCDFLLGSVAQRVLSSAKCDVLVMPKGSHRGSARLSTGGTWLDSGSRKTLEPIHVAPKTAREATLSGQGSREHPQARSKAVAQAA
ncbi:MAG: universal stress protein [Burkholderiaceae bacterium]